MTAPGKNTPRGQGEGRGRARAPRAPRAGRGAAANIGDRKPDNRRPGHGHSGHALADSEKRVASGWGADEGKAELAAEVEGAVDASTEAAAPDADAAAPAAATEAPAAEKKVEEEEDNTKSYEEYLAEKAKTAAAFGQLEGRQVTGTSDFVGSALKKTHEVEDPFFSGLKASRACARRGNPVLTLPTSTEGKGHRSQEGNQHQEGKDLPRTRRPIRSSFIR